MKDYKHREYKREQRGETLAETILAGICFLASIATMTLLLITIHVGA